MTLLRTYIKSIKGNQYLMTFLRNSVNRQAPAIRAPCGNHAQATWTVLHLELVSHLYHIPLLIHEVIMH